MPRYLVLIFLIFIFPPTYAAKIALVIGNSAYNKNYSVLKLSRLSNPVNDAIDIAAELRNLGFEVILKTNIGKKAMKVAVRDFSRRLRKRGTVGLFFFSGHGIQHNNLNYLIPLKADIQTSIDVDDEAFKANYVLRHMKKYNSNGVNIIILDACRNSIPEDVFQKRESMGFDGINQGLTSMNAPTGGLIAYATAPNKVSWGGLPGERNSVYTKHLLKALREQANASIVNLFMQVRRNVMAETKTETVQQVPWELSSLTKQFCFGQCGISSKPNVSILLRTCASHLQANRLTTGSSNAFSCYQKVLSRDETNQQALNGLTTIESRYASWARSAFNRGDKKRAKIYLDRLAMVNPDSPTLHDFDFTPKPPEPATGVFQDRLKDGSRGPKMVWIPKGSFQMGSNEYSREKPVHRVSIDRFAMGQTEVTFAEYDKYAQATGKSKPSDKGWGRGNRPVINVSWHDAVAYAKWLSQETGYIYRLPTEAEWEYAARAGTDTKYWWGDKIGTNNANCYGCGSKWDDKQTAPVRSFAANPYGIYDTVGNVWEWCADIYSSSYYKHSPSSNPKGPSSSGGSRVVRGGSWLSDARFARAAYRRHGDPGYSDGLRGFRCARVQK